MVKYATVIDARVNFDNKCIVPHLNEFDAGDVLNKAAVTLQS